MIVYDLNCPTGHRFEGWFGSSEDFANQQQRGLVTCPACGSVEVTKAPMAPAVPAKSNQRAESAPEPTENGRHAMAGGRIPPEVQQAMRALAEAQAKALAESKWVGENFAQESRAMHYGERELEAIHGKATLEEAKDLLEEGIEIAPVLFPLAEPGEIN